MIQAIIFDLNGVIVDDEPLHEQAFREVLQPLGMTMTHRDYQQYFLGRSDVAGLEYWAQNHSLPIPLEEIYQQKMDRYWQLTQAGIPLMPGAVETIKQLAPLYRLAVTTGATKAELKAVFAQHQLAQYFSVTVTTEDFTKSKPNPEPYLLTAKKLGLPPAACVVIEDAVAGVQSAKTAGMHCIALANTFPADQLQEADDVVAGLSEIPSCIQHY